MFDPNLGRWTSEDPLGFAAGDANLFRYAKNNPVTWSDPSGYIFIVGPGENGVDYFTSLFNKNNISWGWYAENNKYYMWINPEQKDKLLEILAADGFAKEDAELIVKAAIGDRDNFHLELNFTNCEKTAFEHDKKSKNGKAIIAMDRFDKGLDPIDVFPKTIGAISKDIDNKKSLLPPGVLPTFSRRSMFAGMKREEASVLARDAKVLEGSVKGTTHKIYGPLKDGVYAGTGGAGPCIALIVIGDGQLVVFHFDPTDAIGPTLAQYKFKRARAVIAGGDESMASRHALRDTKHELDLKKIHTLA